MTTTSIITNIQYQQDKFGERANFVDMESYCDKPQIKKRLGIKGKILNVFVRTYHDPLYINVSNQDIPLAMEVYAREIDDGAFRVSMYGYQTTHCVKNAIGDAWIVVSNPPVKKS
jgi:hypothetical protein